MGLGVREDGSSQGRLGSRIRNSRVLVTLCTAVWDIHLYEGSSVSVRPPKNGCRGGYTMEELTKLLTLKQGFFLIPSG